MKALGTRNGPGIRKDLNASFAKSIFAFCQVGNVEANVAGTERPRWLVLNRKMQLVVADLIPRAVLPRGRRLGHLFESEQRTVEVLCRLFDFRRDGDVDVMKCGYHKPTVSTIWVSRWNKKSPRPSPRPHLLTQMVLTCYRSF